MRIAPDEKTMVTLDLQLNANCIKLQGKEEIRNNFVFRMGALHTVFAILHAIGKFINASGLDLCFQKADIYGEATIEQIKGGKQMKRGVDASISMCLALQRKYLDCVLLENVDFEENLKETVKDHAELISKHKTVEKNYHQLLL